ncbi:MAG: hypothetical protein KGZ33_06080 [Alkaliphilus sp.]|nr:hypothetical protein [Alkaliphilus sp.]
MKRFLTIILTLMMIISIPATIFAAENTKDTFVLEKDELVNHDLFLGAGYIKIIGSVNGDVFAVGGDFENNGHINGDIILGAGNSIIGGKVDGDLRIGAGRVVIGGEIARNATVLSSDILLEKNSAINGNLNVLSGKATLNGFVGGDFRAGAENVLINGLVKGDVEVGSSTLTFGPDAKINGNLTYTSANEMLVPEGVVDGQVIRKEPAVDENFEENRKKAEEGIKVFHVVKRALSILSYLIVGTILTLIFTGFMRKTALTIQEKPLHSLGLGFVGLIVIPIAALLVMLTVIGIPIGIISLMIYGVLLYLAKLPVALWIGSKILKGETKPLLPMILGIFILMLVSFIPYLGNFVSFVAIVFGIGSYMINLRNVFQKPKDIEPLL